MFTNNINNKSIPSNKFSFDDAEEDANEIDEEDTDFKLSPKKNS